MDNFTQAVNKISSEIRDYAEERIRAQLLSRKLTSEEKLKTLLKGLQEYDASKKNITRSLADNFTLPASAVDELLKEVDAEDVDQVTQRLLQTLHKVAVSEPTDT